MRMSLILGVALLLGCGGSTKPPAPPPPPPLISLTPPAPEPSAEATAPAEGTEVEPATVAALPVETEQVEAKVGVGKKGRALDEHEGLVVTPVKGLFAAKEMIAFEIMVPQALALYVATEGNYPKTHEEFWDKIIVAGQVELPELPAGHRYVYVPEKQQLMVERPK
jgi:hypothetical protein